MTDKQGIAQANRPVQLTWRNRRVKTRETNDGVFFLLEVEVDEETWGWAKTIPRNANGEAVVWVTEVGMITEKPEKEKKAKPQKGPHGRRGYHLHADGFVGQPGIRDAIEGRRENGSDERHVLMRKVFGVDSLSWQIGPKQIYEIFPEDQYPQVKVMVEQARRKADP